MPVLAEITPMAQASTARITLLSSVAVTVSVNVRPTPMLPPACMLVTTNT